MKILSSIVILILSTTAWASPASDSLRNVDWQIAETPQAGGNADFCTSASNPNIDQVGTYENMNGCTAVAVFIGDRSNISDMLTENRNAYLKAQELLKTYGLKANILGNLVQSFYEACQTSLPNVEPCQPGIEIWFTSGPGYADFLKELSTQLSAGGGHFSLVSIARPKWNIRVAFADGYCGANNYSHIPDILTYFSSTEAPYSTSEMQTLVSSHSQYFEELEQNFAQSISQGFTFFLDKMPATTEWYDQHKSYDWLKNDPTGDFEFSVTVEADGGVGEYEDVYVQDFSSTHRYTVQSIGDEGYFRTSNHCEP